MWIFSFLCWWNFFLHVNDRFVFCLFTAARDQPEPERPNTTRDQPEPERPNSASQGRIGLYWPLGVTAAAAVLLVCGLLIFHLLSKSKYCLSESNDGSE